MSLRDVCRLCLSTKNLVWIFDKRIQSPDNMKEVIFITTGVEIIDKDTISQKICSECCHITLKMFRFRCNAAKNDKRLKAKSTELLNTIKPEIPLPTNVEAPGERVGESLSEGSTSMKQMSVIHSSIGELFKVYPHLKLPSSCLEYDVSPFIMLEPRKTVKQYLRKQRKRLKLLAEKQQLQQFNDIRKLLLKFSNVKENVSKSLNKSPPPQKVHIAKKRTTQITKHKLNVETNKATVSDFSNGDRCNIEASDVSEPPIKMIKLDESILRICSSGRKSTPSNNSVIQSTQPLTSIAKENQTIEQITPTSTRISSNKSVTSDIEPLGEIEKTKKLYVCKICNSIHNSRKDLKVHQRTHIRCHLCKRHLRSLLERDAHLKECTNLKIRVALPEIHTSEVESDTEVRKKYPEIVKATKITEESKDNKEAEKSKNNILLPTVKENMALPSTATKNDDNLSDIVDISEDDDFEITRPQIPRARTPLTFNKALQPQTTTSVNTIPLNLPHSISSIPNCTTPATISLNIHNANISHQRRQIVVTSDSLEIAALSKINETLLKINNVGCIKPDIKISGKHWTSNQGSSDIQILKETLKGLTHKITIEIPSDDTIHADAYLKTCNFRSLKTKIQSYKILVQIRSGDMLSARYNKQSISSRLKIPLTQNHYWHDIQPITCIARPKSMPNLNEMNGTSSLEQQKRNTDDLSVTCPPPLIAIGNTAKSSMIHLKNSDQSFGNKSSMSAGSITLTSANDVPFHRPPPPYPSKSIENSALSKITSNILTNNVNVYKTPLPYPAYKTGKVTNVIPSQPANGNSVMLTNTILNGLFAVPTTNYNPINRNVNSYPFSFPKKANTQSTINVSCLVSSSSTSSLSNSVTNTAPSIDLNNNSRKIHLTVTPQPSNQNVSNSVINYRFNLLPNPVGGRDPIHEPSQIVITAGSIKQGTIRVKNIADLT